MQELEQQRQQERRGEDAGRREKAGGDRQRHHRVAEQPGRQERLGNAALLREQGRERQPGDEREEQDRRGKPRQGAAAPAQDQQRARDGDRQQRRAGVIDPRLDPPRLQHLQRAIAQREGRGADRDVQPEDPPPGEGVGDPAAEHRAGDAGGGPHARDIGLVSAALARGDDVGDRRLRHDEQSAAADPLQRPEDDELGKALREAAQHRGEDEPDDRRQQQRAPAIKVGKLAVDRAWRRWR